MASPARRSITDREVDDFARDGAVLLKQVLSQEWVERAREGLDEAIASRDALSGDLGTLRVDQFPARRSESLRSLVEESPLAEIVGRALASPVRFYMDQLFYKPAGEVPPTAWHQDTCYYNIEGHDVIRAWVSPDLVPRHLSLEVVRGSHLWNVTYRPLAGADPETSERARKLIEGADSQRQMLGEEAYERWNYWSGVHDRSLPEVPDVNARRDAFEILGWHYEPGDVLLFHGNILHSALGDAESPTPRRAHASLWAGRDVRYLHRLGQIIPDPIGLYAHEPRSGQPLSDFEDVFPVRWAPEAER